MKKEFKPIYRRILIAIDGSRFSMNVAEKGIGLCRQLNAEMGFVYVVDNGLAQNKMTELHNEGNLFVDLLAEEIKTKPIKFIELGKPKYEILLKALKWDADLIVMGNRGRTDLKSGTNGSVADHIIKHSKCPVLIVSGIS